MPAPLNMIHREYAHATREPAAAFAQGMARLYEGIALIEMEELEDAVGNFRSATVSFQRAARHMLELPAVERRWEVREPEIFSVLMDRFSQLAGSTPLGDRALIDVLVSEVQGLATVTGNTERIPGLAEEQALLVGRVLRQAMRAQSLGLLATEISLVTSARHS